MALQHDLDLLQRVALFRDFPEDQLRLLAFGTERDLLRAGRELFRQGEKSQGGFVIAGGQIDLVMYRGGRELVMDSCGEASLVGELGLVTQSHQATAAVARTNSEAMFIPRALFHRMLNTFPQTAAVLHERIAASVHSMLQQLELLHASIEAAPKFQLPKRK